MSAAQLSFDIGRWWLGEQLAEYMREPAAKVSLDMHRHHERGALYRERGGVDPRGRTVWLWATTQGQP